MATTALRREVGVVSPTRQRGLGLVFMLLGLAIWLFFASDVDSQALTTFGLNPGGSKTTLPDWVFQSQPALNILAIICTGLGAYQLARGFRRYANWFLAVVVGMFVFGFLTWAASGQSLNLVGMLDTSLGRAVPIVLAALSGILSERAGVVNIAIEGMMLAGAMAGTLVGSLAGSPWIGLLAGVAVGGVLGLIHGVLSIKYRTDQIISGVVINIFAGGLTAFVSARFLQPFQHLNDPGIIRQWPIPLLSELPIIGPILFSHNFITYAMFIFLFVLQIGFFYTRWGLRYRSVGEHPKAADTLGINVFRTRYMAVILSGMMGGFAGAYFTVGSVGRFDEFMTAGRGFIGLAAMIFGNWIPFGAFGAGMLFGFADALAAKLAILGVAIPSQFLLMTPYLATMIVLAGVVGRGQMPAADGQPYVKE
jgi:simple sugar transport system permease protein